MTRKVLFTILKILSQLVLKRYKPKIIAITGSVGKTSSKEAIFQILKNKFNVRRTRGNQNNEIGVPLTILNIKNTPGKNIFGWLKVFLKALGMIIIKIEYPDKLVLEFGADHAGDIDYLVNFIPVNIGVLTKISKAHIKYFKTEKSIFNEKKKIFKNIPSQGYAIINNDDRRIRTLKDQLNCRVLTYGIENNSDIYATALQIVEKNGVIGMNFKVIYQGNTVPVFLPESLGLPQVYAFLSGVAVAVISGVNLVEISDYAQGYIPPRGRTKLLDGINGSYIIDDTYNSSPEPVKISIDLLNNMRGIILGRRIAVLGDMLELGRESIPLHKEIGKYVAKRNIDKLLTIGSKSRNTHREAEKYNFNSDNNIYFKEQKELIAYLKSILREGDLVLIKGSQEARMERIVKAIMRNSDNAKDLLVRQTEEWLN